MILVCSERFSSQNMCETFFDINWRLLPFSENNHRIDETINKPKNLKKMLEFSKKIAKFMPFVRLDWYDINGSLYFGEITFFPSSGFEKFNPEDWNLKFGNMLKIKKDGEY